ncbi:MAG TPA: hypothetical protein VK611_04320 [Acidimicrobiales bacterium]|nr:hypothetical protein [Acidimicrobiales bacterium]
MDDTPQDPRPPERPPFPPSPPTDPPPEQPTFDDDLPPGGDLPPLADLDGDGPGKRRLPGGRRLLAAAVVALVLVAGGAAFALGGGGDGDDDDDGVASIDGSDGAEDGDDSSSDGSGGNGRVDDSEFQDAMLEYAACMRDHGVDMPDPEFNGEGGVAINAGPATGDREAAEETMEAADEACQPIMEDVMPDIQLSPEEQAQMQDEQRAVAQCMRDKGWDMPDPQVGDDGSVRVEGGPGGNGRAMSPENQEDNLADMEACQEELGIEGGPKGGRLGTTDGPESDSDSDDEGSA